MPQDDYIPPMPASRADGTSALRRLMMARRDVFSALPSRLYRGWMGQVNTPLYKSFVLIQPELVKTVLEERPEDFPKSNVLRDSLYLLLGDSIFVTNGETWKRQRRIIDPAFEGGRLREAFPGMAAAAQASVDRLSTPTGAPVSIDYECAHVAADVIFRTLFSIPISDTRARQVFDGFRDYGRTAPLVSLQALLRLPPWVPRIRSRRARRATGAIRAAFADIIEQRQRDIAAGTAPDDLATKIMTTADPETGERFSNAEMVDQVAVFFLAGHETSASVLAWALYMLAERPDYQDRAAEEALAAWGEDGPAFSDLRKLPFIRDVFRESLRLYPAVPTLVREAAKAERFRDRDVPRGSLCLVSTWFLHRQERIWDRPHVFDPDRWRTAETRETARSAYIPFATGPRVCPGAGFAMAEGVLILAALLRAYRFTPVEGRRPKPSLNLTVRSSNGIYLSLSPR